MAGRWEGPRRIPRALPLVLVAASSCSVRQLAIDGLAGALSSSADSFASEEDPELVRDALPFALKAMEAVLLEDPEQEDLLLSACSGFTQYAYAFVATDAKLLEDVDYERSTAMKERALRLFLRARGYGLRGLELRHAGIGERLIIDPEAAVGELDREDLPFAFWTGSAWGLALSLALDRPEIVADVDVVRSLLRRSLELDETYADGAIHEALIVIEALPEMMGGSPQRAREHFERAVELTRGRTAGPYVTLAESVAVPSQNRAEFESLLRRALEVDPDAEPSVRLANVLAQAHARHLLMKADDLFLEPLD